MSTPFVYTGPPLYLIPRNNLQEFSTSYFDEQPDERTQFDTIVRTATTMAAMLAMMPSVAEAEHEEQDTNVNDFDQSYDDEEFMEGCPDCGHATVVTEQSDDYEDYDVCMNCGWRN